MKTIKTWLDDILLRQGVIESIAPYLSFLIFLITSVLLSIIGVYICRIILRQILIKFIKKTQSKWGRLLKKHKFTNTVSLLIAVFILKITIPLLFESASAAESLLEQIVNIYFLLVIYKVIISFSKSTEDYISTLKIYADKPIASYFQLFRIVIIIVLIILALSILIGKSPIYLLSAFGAISAILLLIFKDTILGLVASVQISANDMVRVGDWIEMVKFNTDGHVLAINLNTVKIKNWDNTISTVPTYHFITESFKNWRGMQSSGGRRISRALRVSLNSVRFVDPQMREEFKKIELIKDYINKRQAEIEKYNIENAVNTEILINGRRMTNIGIFRIYILNYLQSLPTVRKDMLLVVRQQTPDEFGIPLQIYCFANTITFVEYERIQSDIFDHLFASAPFFGLEIFQKPSGKDLGRIK